MLKTEGWFAVSTDGSASSRAASRVHAYKLAQVKQAEAVEAEAVLDRHRSMLTRRQQRWQADRHRIEVHALNQLLRKSDAAQVALFKSAPAVPVEPAKGSANTHVSSDIGMAV